MFDVRAYGPPPSLSSERLMLPTPSMQIEPWFPATRKRSHCPSPGKFRTPPPRIAAFPFWLAQVQTAHGVRHGPPSPNNGHPPSRIAGAKELGFPRLSHPRPREMPSFARVGPPCSPFDRVSRETRPGVGHAVFAHPAVSPVQGQQPPPARPPTLFVRPDFMRGGVGLRGPASPRISPFKGSPPFLEIRALRLRMERTIPGPVLFGKMISLW